MFKHYSKSILTVLFLFIIGLYGCKDNPSGNNEEDKEYFLVNDWMRNTMETYYFWNEEVPENTDGQLNPESYFEAMLHDEDIFSYMSDDAESLNQELEGSSFTAGFSPAFGAFTNSPGVYIIIEFVYPGTPAEEAGLKRGDIIMAINGTQMNRTNYQELYYSEDTETSYTLGAYDEEENSLTVTDSVVTLQKQQLDLDPVVYTNVYERNGSKIGYMFYAQFIVGDDENEPFIASVDAALEDFAARGIDEFVLDLRYNPGGRIVASQNLANSLAPQSDVSNEEVFVRYQYNEILEQAYREQGGVDSPNLVVRFSEDPVNLNLDRVFFLTTGSSASASELLINGLKPYMDVVTVGQNTFGKFYGAFVLNDSNTRKDNPPPRHNYAIVPVTLKYANANGVTDFRDGLVPDYEVEESLFNAVAIGDTTDPLLGKALEVITGEQQEPVAKQMPFRPFEVLPDHKKLKQGAIFYDDPARLPMLKNQ